MEPYNPQQWRGQASGTQMVFQQRGNAGPSSTREVTGMEGASEPTVKSTVTCKDLEQLELSIDTTTFRPNAFASTSLQP